MMFPFSITSTGSVILAALLGGIIMGGVCGYSVEKWRLDAQVSELKQSAAEEEAARSAAAESALRQQMAEADKQRSLVQQGASNYAQSLARINALSADNASLRQRLHDAASQIPGSAGLPEARSTSAGTHDAATDQGSELSDAAAILKAAQEDSAQLMALQNYVTTVCVGP